MNQHRFLLKAIQISSPKLRRAILQNSDKSFTRALCEIIHNLLFKKIQISPAEVKNLRAYKSHLRSLAKRGGTFKEKQTILVRVGGGRLLPKVIEIFFRFLKKNGQC